MLKSSEEKLKKDDTARPFVDASRACLQISVNAWIWSTVFHSRDWPVTEVNAEQHQGSTHMCCNNNVQCFVVDMTPFLRNSSTSAVLG